MLQTNAKTIVRPYLVPESETTHIGRFDIVMDTILKDGKESPYSYIVIKECSAVLPVYRGKVVMIRQYRHTVNAWEWEFPAGMIKPGDTPEETAVKELEEETGFVAAKITDLGGFYPS